MARGVRTDIFVKSLNQVELNEARGMRSNHDRPVAVPEYFLWFIIRGTIWESSVSGREASNWLIVWLSYNKLHLVACLVVMAIFL